MNDFIFELISEEIPAKMQAPAMRQLEILTLKKVNENGLIFGEMVPFVTPMRLGIILENISIEVKESIKEIRGPRLGAPANAIDGFLKKNNSSFRFDLILILVVIMLGPVTGLLISKTNILDKYKFFDYPIKPLNAFYNLGSKNAFLCTFSYLKSKY